MPQNFTPNHLLSLLYKETNQTEKQKILHEMITDPAIAEEFYNLSEMIGLLSDIELAPHPTSVSIIMEYSAKTHEVQHA